MKLPMTQRRGWFGPEKGECHLFLAFLGMVMCFLWVGPTVARGQQTSIIDSAHNLSASGPGQVRAVSEQQVCIFCHTPHNAAPIQPLWNRSLPLSAYTVYSSTSLQAKPGQPTGSSKLCLSCHDGTIAVGSVLSRGQPIAMAGGITTIPPGHGNIGTDLSDDHPISFRYDNALSAQDPKIKPPAALPEKVRLDANQEMQCTTCHDAHNNAFGKFLVMDNHSSQLCSSCHQINDTSISAHVTCASCHTMHSAPSGAMLLTGVNSSETCLTCHSSQPAPEQGKNIAMDLTKPSRHDTVARPVAPGSVGCSDCHESHTMRDGVATAPLLSPKLGKISGVSIASGQLAAAKYEYEVCFKCHGKSNVTEPRVPRRIEQNDTRLEFASNAISFHPVTAAGRSQDVPSLRSVYTTGSLIGCTDCHSSDTGASAGGIGPSGPHGSSATPLLIARYETFDNTAESAVAYALCYRCHDRTSILNNESFTEHSRHVQTANVPCSICHDPHGISSAQGTPAGNAHLINFDTTVVKPDPVSGKLEYRSTGPRTGMCSLTCHGVVHTDRQYPALPALGLFTTQNLGNARRGAVAPAPQTPVRPPTRSLGGNRTR